MVGKKQYDWDLRGGANVGEAKKQFMLDCFPKLGRHFLKAPGGTVYKKPFLCGGRDGGETNRNYCRVLLSLEVGGDFQGPRCCLRPHRMDLVAHTPL